MYRNPERGSFSFRPLVQGDNQVLKMLVAYWQKEHHDNGYTPSPKILVWNPYQQAIAGALRLGGLQAWDMTPHPPETEWGLQGDLHHSPIKPYSVHIAWSLERVSCGAMLCALKDMVSMHGFLIAELEEDWMRANLLHNGWFRLPFRFHGFEIFKKRRVYGGGNGNGREFEQSA